MNSAVTQRAEAWLGQAHQLVQRHPRRLTAVVAALLLGGAGGSFAVANLGPDAAQLPVRSIVEDVSPNPLGSTQADVDTVATQALQLYRSDTTRANDTVEILLKRLGIFDPQAAASMRADKVLQQSVLGRSGRNVSAEASANGELIKLTARWSPSDDGTFKRLTFQRDGNGFSSRLETLPLSATTRLASGVIHSSLFAATDDARMPDSIAIQLAEIFSGDIDFHRSLRKGDRFSVVYETLEGDGEPLRTGRVLSAEFVNNGKSLQAMWFQEPSNGSAQGSQTATASVTAATSASRGGYYTLSGESLKRAFLASPMEFSRVSSGFKMRFHPILKTWRAHLGTDYAAPTGTPARTVGDGVVSFAGVQNGFGNVVMVEHRNQQTTVYAHLSKILVKRGQSVTQGQHIGLVGATGWATGPHLHFEFRVNGQHKDPATIARQGESLPVAAHLRPAFDQAAQQVRQQLAAAAQVRATSVE